MMRRVQMRYCICPSAPPPHPPWCYKGSVQFNVVLIFCVARKTPHTSHHLSEVCPLLSLKQSPCRFDFAVVLDLPPPLPPPILQGFGSAQCGTYVARRTPYASPCMSEVCLVLSLKQFLCVGLICYSSVLPSRGTSWEADFFHASLLKAVVLGFVATDSTSSSWAHQIFHSINNKPLLVVAVPNKSVCLGISIDSII